MDHLLLPLFKLCFYLSFYLLFLDLLWLFFLSLYLLSKIHRKIYTQIMEGGEGESEWNEKIQMEKEKNIAVNNCFN